MISFDKKWKNQPGATWWQAVLQLKEIS